MNSDSIEIPVNVAVKETGYYSETDAQEMSAVVLLKRVPTTVEDVNAVRSAAFSNPRTWDRLDHYVREVMKEGEPDYEQKHTLGLAILGHYRLAEEKLEAMQNLPVAACLLGRIYMETNREHLAVEIFKKIHERVPEVKDYHFLLADALEAAGDVDGFRRELEKLEASDPTHPNTICLKAISLELDGEYEEAKSLYEKTLEINPNHQTALFRTAYRADLQGKDDEAMTLYRRCIDAGISNVAAL
ncbi:MAG: tetratricopeptide repeat protein, partial [Planctomycetes bacterium]|nr:tetratricopeptide repeat protein [Planctomycetota bacterium]